MSFYLALMQARADLLDQGMENLAETLAYFKAHGIGAQAERDYSIGAATVCKIADCGSGKFDFDESGFPALVCEALAEDAETTIDLVAWPLDRPAHVMTMFGKCGLLGAFDAFNPATYCMGTPLIMHKTPLDFFKSGYRGAAIVTPKLAARQMIDISGQIAARDHRHGRELKTLIDSVIPRDRVVIPAQSVRRAA